MTPTQPRQNLIRPAIVLLAAAALAVAGILIWLWARPVDATSVLEDACADAVPTPFYDMVDEGFTPDDPFVKERHMITSADTGVFQQSSWNRRGQPSARAEVIYLIPTPEPQDEAPHPSRTRTYITYTRKNNRDGQWEGWVFDERPLGNEHPINTSGARTDEELQAFCGTLLSGFRDITYDGEETLNGATTKKFTLTLDIADQTWYWVR